LERNGRSGGGGKGGREGSLTGAADGGQRHEVRGGDDEDVSGVRPFDKLVIRIDLGREGGREGGRAKMSH